MRKLPPGLFSYNFLYRENSRKQIFPDFLYRESMRMANKSHYTTSEAAALFDVTRQSIGNAIRGLRIDALKGKRGYLLTVEQMNALAEHFGAEPIKAEPQTRDNQALAEAVKALTAQLEMKDKQIQGYQEEVLKLNDQISSLLETNKALSASNALQVAADKKEKLLAEPKEEQEPKKGFWKRLFG